MQDIELKSDREIIIAIHSSQQNTEKTLTAMQIKLDNAATKEICSSKHVTVDKRLDGHDTDIGNLKTWRSWAIGIGGGLTFAFAIYQFIKQVIL